MIETTESLLGLIEEIARLPEAWHGAGSVSPEVLRAIVRHAEGAGPIEHSVETGSGKTTLLFSHLSGDHIVFAYDHAGSVSKVKASPLFRPEAVTYVEGFTQVTVPGHDFAHKLQLVLIDGPHGYPFPDLEYYYLYPHIATGGLLLVDDIQIPTIGRMYDIIRADKMFELVEVVATTAFFRRTEAEVFDPYGDGWWLQGYNAAYAEEMTNPRPPAAPPGGLKGMLRSLAPLVPGPLKKMVPQGIKRALRG